MTKVYVREGDIPDGMLRAMGIQPAEASRRLKGYSPELCAYLIDVIRKKCPGVRRVVYEEEEPEQNGWWVAHIDPPPSTLR